MIAGRPRVLWLIWTSVRGSGYMGFLIIVIVAVGSAGQHWRLG